MQNLTQDIKNHSFKPVYLLYGDEAFLKNSYKNQLKNAISGDDTMNYNYFEGKGLDLNELISLADTMAFFSEKRLIMGEVDSSRERQTNLSPIYPRCRIRPA